LDRAPKEEGVVADERDMAQVHFAEELGDQGGERRQGEAGCSITTGLPSPVSEYMRPAVVGLSSGILRLCRGGSRAH